MIGVDIATHMRFSQFDEASLDWPYPKTLYMVCQYANLPTRGEFRSLQNFTLYTTVASL
jgi:hypothetical protein